MKQVKMIIIDDEPIILRGLVETYPWHEMGFTIVGTTTKPKVGIELIKEKKPQVVLTDIRMNQMSGLALIEQVKEFDSAVVFIIMSAYKEFEYARKACQQGVFTYLVKPIEEKVLIETMQSVYTYCQSKMDIADENIYLKRILLDQKENFQNGLIKHYLQEEINENSFRKSLEIMGIILNNENGFICVQVRLDLAYSMLSQEEFEIQSRTLFSYLKKQIFTYYKSWYFNNGPNEITFILNLEETEDVYKIKEILCDLRRIIQIEVSSVLSSICYGLQELKEAYVQLQEKKIENVKESSSIEKDKKYYNEYIAKSLEYIDENLVDENLSITSVSEYVYLNPAYFGRIFKNALNISFKQYVLNKRIELAKKKIMEGDSSMITIGNAVGISNSSYFTQVFKKTTGYLPSEYKKEMMNEREVL